MLGIIPTTCMHASLTLISQWICKLFARNCRVSLKKYYAILYKSLKKSLVYVQLALNPFSNSYSYTRNSMAADKHFFLCRIPQLYNYYKQITWCSKYLRIKQTCGTIWNQPSCRFVFFLWDDYTIHIISCVFRIFFPVYGFRRRIMPMPW